MNRIAPFFFFLLMGSCVVGPNYHRPRVPIPQTWLTNVEESEKYSNIIWWQQFNDRVLDELILIALQENKDLMIATGRVEEFLGRYQVTRSDLFPKVDGEGLYGVERVSEKLTPLGPGVKNPDKIYKTFFSGSWELDLWGRLSRATEAASADLLASEEARQAVILTLVASVAAGYIDLLRLDQQLEISILTTEARKKSLDIFTLRHEAGVISNIELSQIESEYQASKATIPSFQKAIAQQEYALSVLVGRNPGPIPREGSLDKLKYPEIPPNLPAELLCNRPDIREAENLLVAANARIGVARAAYLPAVSLTGIYGNASKKYKDLFTGEALMWNYFTPVSLPIFTAGELRGQLRIAEGVTYQAAATYKKRIQQAFQEVEDALIDNEKTKEQLSIQKKQVDALKDYSELATLRYNNGYSSYLEVLDAERSLFNAQLDYSDTWSNLFLSYVSIYKSLGGGWVCQADWLTQ